MTCSKSRVAANRNRRGGRERAMHSREHTIDNRSGISTIVLVGDLALLDSGPWSLISLMALAVPQLGKILSP